MTEDQILAQYPTLTVQGMRAAAAYGGAGARTANVKLKVHENLTHNLADDLTGHGHDVDTVADEGLAGADDPAVLRAATGEDRLLVTLDRGFGGVRIYPPDTDYGCVVLRPISRNPASISGLVNRFLDVCKLEDLRGRIVVVEPERIRIRRPDRHGSS